jgi:hypothetical protein
MFVVKQRVIGATMVTISLRALNVRPALKTNGSEPAYSP